MTRVQKLFSGDPVVRRPSPITICRKSLLARLCKVTVAEAEHGHIPARFGDAISKKQSSGPEKPLAKPAATGDFMNDGIQTKVPKSQTSRTRQGKIHRAPRRTPQEGHGILIVVDEVSDITPAQWRDLLEDHADECRENFCK